ncbi:MAG TPA: sulfatase-like hydrolase/transferase, partial [Bacillota bacterium]|nr:sulfatase-like hydrolase/transferase [Bacillota bacterium]
LGSFALCGLLSDSSHLLAAETPKPNVLVIIADDQGSVDAGCYGAKDLVTPAVDSLAARGVRFTQFYSAAPVCSPSRAGFLTGRYPWLVGMPNNGAAPPTEAADQTDGFTGDGISAKALTLADTFRAAGYATAHIGKWHLGYGLGHKPLDKGFDYSFGFLGGCIDNYTHFFYWDGPNRHDLWENNQRVRLPGRYFPDLMVEKAKAFIGSHRDQPFFMYFAINMPHYPYQGDPKWLKHYENLPYPRKLYAAFVSTLDERVQQLVTYLEASGLRERTIIVYQSDNGHSVEARAHYGGGSSGPYRGAKFSLFEGGIRLPAIISWPGHLPEGQVRGQVAHGCDWLPTLAELCSVPLPKAELNGRSLVPVLRSADAPSPHDVLHWRLGDQWAVRQGPWKLLHNPNDQADAHKLAPGDKEWFLVNVEADPGEQTNLAARHPEMLERLRKLAPIGPGGSVGQ